MRLGISWAAAAMLGISGLAAAMRLGTSGLAAAMRPGIKHPPNNNRQNAYGSVSTVCWESRFTVTLAVGCWHLQLTDTLACASEQHAACMLLLLVFPATRPSVHPTQEASALEQNVKGKAVSAEAKRAQAVASIRREEGVLSQQASELAGQVQT